MDEIVAAARDVRSIAHAYARFTAALDAHARSAANNFEQAARARNCSRDCSYNRHLEHVLVGAMERDLADLLATVRGFRHTVAGAQRVAAKFSVSSAPSMASAEAKAKAEAESKGEAELQAGVKGKKKKKKKQPKKGEGGDGTARAPDAAYMAVTGLTHQRVQEWAAYVSEVVAREHGRLASIAWRVQPDGVTKRGIWHVARECEDKASVVSVGDLAGVGAAGAAVSFAELVAEISGAEPIDQAVVDDISDRLKLADLISGYLSLSA
ncbi:hypothetical protein AYI70_g7405 [Smittium culicis]|uniref:Uncharacterized protein n=1 Tax=Smittium culicis TaxID=133412 RepID=A0A1R1XKQ8_9FUNG|nr:hypothetical protein AYI70_g7405 [Smittium culicis]